MAAQPAPERTGSLPRLHVITNPEVVSRPGFLEGARAVMEAGGADVVLQLRVPGLPGRRLFELAGPLVDEATRTGAWLMVSDRVDVALACGARGAHLPGSGLDPVDARRVWPDGILGVSCHEASRVEERTGAAAGAVDYVTVGTLFATPSHPGHAGAGAGLIRNVRAALQGAGAPVPLLGIGGISVERVEEVVAAGAHGVAVIRGVWGGVGTGPAEQAGRVGAFLRALGPG